MTPLPLSWEQVQASPQLLAAALLVVLLSVVVAYVIASKLLAAPRRDALLLLGPSGAGKTALFCLLRDGQPAPAGTVTSMQANEEVVRLSLGPQGKQASTRPLRVVDMPGHPRLRSLLEPQLPHARAVVFLVDGGDGAFLPSVRVAAEMLFELLTHPVVARRRTPVLLGVNKTDRGAACHTVDFVRRRLEAELDQLRVTRGSLAETGASRRAAAAPLLGRAGVPFTLAQLPAPGVRVAGLSVTGGDVAPLHDFLAAAGL